MHIEICCESDDPCLLGTINPDTMLCEFEYSCCGNGLCDQPGDVANCPEECEFDEGGSGDVNISNIIPTPTEGITLDGDSVDISGWTIDDEAGTTFTFPPGFVISGKVRVHTVGCPEDDNDTDLYWGIGSGDCREGPIWNDDGDTATLRNDSWDIVDEYSY